MNKIICFCAIAGIAIAYVLLDKGMVQFLILAILMPMPSKYMGLEWERNGTADWIRKHL